MAKDGELYAMILEGFWMDIGQPKDYLAGSSLFLDHLQKTDSELLSKNNNIKGNVMIVKNYIFNYLLL